MVPSFFHPWKMGHGCKFCFQSIQHSVAHFPGGKFDSQVPKHVLHEEIVTNTAAYPVSSVIL